MIFPSIILQEIGVLYILHNFPQAFDESPMGSSFLDDRIKQSATAHQSQDVQR